MTPEVPVSPSADAGSFSSASSLLDSVLDAPTQQSAPEPPQQSAPEPPPEPEQVEQAEEAPEQVEEQTSDEEAIVDDDNEASEEFTDDAGRKYYNVKPNRMREFVNAKNYLKAVEEFAPTVEAAKANYESASDFRAMQVLFDSGQPESLNQFMNYWATGSPEGFGEMAKSLPAFLASQAGQNPVAAQALHQIESQVHRVTVARAYEKAQATGDPKDLYAAQSIDFAINGKFHESLDKIPARQQPQPQDQIRVREQQIEQREQQFANQRWQDFDNQYITGAKDSALTAAVEAAFAPAASAFPAGLLSAAKREAIAQIKDSIEKNFEFSRNQKVETSDIQRDLVRAIRSGQTTNLEPRAARLVEEFKARVNRVLPGIVKPLIGDATKSVMQQSQATHNRLATGAKKVAPGAGGKPAPRDIFKPNWKSASEGLDALLG